LRLGNVVLNGSSDRHDSAASHFIDTLMRRVLISGITRPFCQRIKKAGQVSGSQYIVNLFQDSVNA